MPININIDAKEVVKHILIKISSGRWILTVICGIVFAYTSIKKIIPVDATISILTMVFIAYFNRHDRIPENGGQK